MRMGPFAPKVRPLIDVVHCGVEADFFRSQGTDKHFDKKQAIAIFKDKYFYLFAIAYFAYANSLNATGCTSTFPLRPLLPSSCFPPSLLSTRTALYLELHPPLLPCPSTTD